MADAAEETKEQQTEAAPAEEQTTASGKPAKQRRGRRRRVSISAEVDNATDDEFTPTMVPKSPEQLTRISAAVSANFLFSNLDSEQCSQVFGAMVEKVVEDGEEIIKQGDAGDFFYVLQSGSADVFVDGSKVHSYDSGSSFGELALMYNCPRAATVTATAQSTLWALDRQTFRHIIYANQSKKRDSYEKFLGSCPLFQDLIPLERSRIADVLEEQMFEPGTAVIMEKDDDFKAMKFYIVIKGEAVAQQTLDSGEVVEVGRIGPGGFFGEKALIERVPRAASVLALGGPLVCACLDVAAFERLLGSCKDLMMRQIDAYQPGSPNSEAPAQGSGLHAVRALAPSASAPAVSARSVSDSSSQSDFDFKSSASLAPAAEADDAAPAAAAATGADADANADGAAPAGQP